MELLATTLCLVALDVRTDDPMGGIVQITGLTDSQVSSNVVSRGQSTAFPLCAVVVELAAQCESRGLDLHLEWVPRGVNSEADALADGEFDGFSPELRVEVDFGNVGWIVLEDLLREGQAFYENAARKAPTAGTARAPRPVGRKRLREREPW